MTSDATPIPDPLERTRLTSADLRKLRHAWPSPRQLIDRPGLFGRRFRVVVIGDVRIDVRANLRGQRFVDMDTDHFEYGPVTTDVGGTAVSFARAALPHFEDTHLVGALGNDTWTDYIRSSCEAAGIDVCLDELPRPNSPAVVVRDEGTDEDPDGVRLLVADDPSPYQSLDAELVRADEANIRTADALVIDGYGLLGESSGEALDVATELAVAAGVPICFDIVPHVIDRYLSFDELRPFFIRSSLISVEAETLGRLLGVTLPAQDDIGASDAIRLVEALPPEVSGPERTWFIRYGVGNTDRTLAMSQQHHRVEYQTGYAEAEDVGGYGYRIAAAELKWWLLNFRLASLAYPDLARRRTLVRLDAAS